MGIAMEVSVFSTQLQGTRQIGSFNNHDDDDGNENLKKAMDIV